MKQMNPAATVRDVPGMASRIRQAVSRVNWLVVGPKLLGTICVFIVGGMLVAGLWPFHSPKNQVTWIPGGNGLHFGHHGTILSSGTFNPKNAAANSAFSVEIWLEPDFTEGEKTLFAFYPPAGHRQFSLNQSLTDLDVRSDIRDGSYRSRSKLYVDDVFHRGKWLFVTVTSDGVTLSVYIDGVLARTTTHFPISSQDIAGELVIANSPVVDNSWAGALQGLAFYRQVLTPAEVHQHFVTWTTNGRPDISQSEHPVALYLFDERAGRVIHNHVATGPGLYIPDRYSVLDHDFLTPFWREFDPAWSYVKDVLVNIGGFVPFGFVVCAYLSLFTRIKRPALLTILLGFTLSLTIEVLQSFLPTRDSGTTDLITNTLGTCCGVWLYRFDLGRLLIAKAWGSFMGNVDQG